MHLLTYCNLYQLKRRYFPGCTNYDSYPVLQYIIATWWFFLRYSYLTSSLLTFQVMFRALPSGSSWTAVKPPTRAWGVCTFVYTKVTPPSPQLRCDTCQSLHCCHTAAIASELEIETNWDEAPLALFKFSMEVSPEMRKYFELVSQSKEKFPLFLSQGMIHDYLCISPRN